MKKGGYRLNRRSSEKNQDKRGRRLASDMKGLVEFIVKKKRCSRSIAAGGAWPSSATQAPK